MTDISRRVQKFSKEDGFLEKWGSGDTGDGQFEQSWGLAIKSAEVTFLQERVFVTDNTNRVQVFKPSTVIEG